MFRGNTAFHVTFPLTDAGPPTSLSTDFERSSFQRRKLSLWGGAMRQVPSGSGNPDNYIFSCICTGSYPRNATVTVVRSGWSIFASNLMISSRTESTLLLLQTQLHLTINLNGPGPRSSVTEAEVAGRPVRRRLQKTFYRGIT